jgi:prepilin-type N-terminal cleavage/methylation domain-containing protein
MLRSNKSPGFTLPELMIALTINALVFSAILTMFIANINHYHQVINANRLHQQLQNIMDLIATDIRRAGYWGSASNDLGLMMLMQMVHYPP